jgi:CMP-N,N'-diacetyllegionaminic acid synthase
MKTTVIIPVRKNSQRIKSKNTTLFSDTTLLDIKINIMKKMKGVDDIVVNSDCETALSIAKTHGINTHKRDPYYASNTVTTNEHWAHLAEVTDADIIILGQTTSPLIKQSTYEDALNLFHENLKNGYDSLNSVTPIKDFLWLDGKPLNYDPNNFPRSQDLPNIVALNFAVTIIKRESLLNLGNVVGNKPFFIELDDFESLDIDDPKDFDLAEALYKKQKSYKQAN